MRIQKTGLSPRERDVLAQLALGRTRMGVAQELGISTGTVNTHIEGAFRFLGASNVVEAVVKFRELC